MAQLESLLSIFRFILVLSIYGAILGLVLLLLKAMIGNRLSPKWHYALWFILVFKLAFPFGPSSTFSIANLLEVDHRISAIEAVAETQPVDNKIMKTRIEAGKFPEYGGLSNNIEAFHEKMNNPVNIITLPQNENQSKGLFSKLDVSQYQKLKLVAAGIWITVATLLSFWFLGTGIVFRRGLKKGAVTLPAEWEALLESSKKTIGFRGATKITCSKGISSPGAYGIFKQKILMGVECLEMEEKQLSYVVLHELAHIKRRDSIVNFLLIFLSIVHWFNPILWICFGKMRQEMEQATDQLVLSKLGTERHKPYGLALLEVLEKLRPRPLATDYIGLVDNKKTLEKRIGMIKMNEHFKAKKKSMLAIGLACMLILSCVFLTNGVEKLQVEAESLSPDQLKMPYISFSMETLYKYKDTKATDVKGIKALIKELHMGTTGKTEVSKGKKTFGIRYEFNNTLNLLDNDLEHTGMKNTIRKSVTVMFALMPKLDYVEVNGLGGKLVKLTRKELQKEYKIELGKIGVSKTTFDEFLRYLSLDIKVFPETYAPVMSSVPGIGITPYYAAAADKIVFTANYGQLLEWSSEGKITELGRTVEKGNVGDTIFWTPLNVLATSYIPSAMEVKVEIYKAGKKLTEKVLRFDDSATGMYKLIEVKNDKFQDLY